jgi:putative SOS response-associated peptidase YedK
MKFRRCLIPADTFFEWKRTARSKQAFCFEVTSCSRAGLWDGRKDSGEQWIKSFSILTTRANAVTSQVHYAITGLLKPIDSSLMCAYPISSQINQVQNE